ncbi:ribonucleotide reductase N-terminal alpha domain-containing protein [Thermovirga sp.]|uniref:ribonucleotide reductase N-terminal alpha domain-containing protein n=1 Tax=Thermovirga sp. TaxID=2699834 RepID=UPI0025DFD6A6|nr:ribonucleotide reductase N-terminal alpha domain-containing protein [Thermovirga sp.]MBO8154529.1 ribonucleoside reductase class II [Thermovirga sp.]
MASKEHDNSKDTPVKMSGNALRVLKERYLIKDNEGNAIETPEQMFMRVARAVAEAEKNYDEAIVEKFYNLMASLDFLPNSPTLMNAGRKGGQLAACFVLPIEDSMEGIFEALKNMALIHKSGGGTGYNFSKLRPAGDKVSSTNGVASGPISFMGMFDQATEVVMQGGMRRGANMGILNADHPDVFRFIRAKTEEGKLKNFNISIGATDKFMKAVENDEDWDLINPRSGEVTKTVKARDLFDLICEMAWRTGDPGMIFLDRLEEDNPTPHLGKIDATNPCVPADTFVMTEEGPRQVKELIGKKAILIINGNPFSTTEEGFFKTGEKPLFLITTNEGYSFRATEDHPVLKVSKKTRYAIEKEWAAVSELKPGDEIMLHDHRNFAGWDGLYGEKEGYLIGLLVGDGTLKKDKAVLSVWASEKAAGDGIESIKEKALEAAKALPHRSDFQGWVEVPGRNECRMSLASLRELAFSLGMEPGNKTITPYMETRTSSEFIRGFLQGLFDSDGSVQGSQEKGISIRLAQSDLNRLKAVQRMLARFGIVSTIYENRRHSKMTLLPDGKGGTEHYQTKPQHELVISRDNILIFAERIGFNDTAKNAKLASLLAAYNQMPNRERFTVTVKSITPAGTEEVYDVQVPGANAFDANGIVVHNCGEQPLLPFEACNLGSINLSHMVKDGKVDWEKLKKTTRLAVRFLDDVIDVNEYPIPIIKETVMKTRKIGLGVMGWADMLFMLRIPYDSEEAIELAKKVMGTITETGREASRELAKERGPYPADRGTGQRNATITTIAPTGSISMIADCSSGIEPVFALEYTKEVLEGKKFTYKNRYYQQALEEGLDKEIIKKVFKTAHEISPEWHVKMQAAFQEAVDNAVSKTINLPNSASIDDVKNAYLSAFKTGCKGITVFRDGCRSEQVLYKEKQPVQQKLPIAATPPGPQPIERPFVLSGKTAKIPTSYGNLYLTVNEVNGRPIEVFTTMGKSGHETMAFTEAIGRLISLALRSGVKIHHIIKQMKGIGGSQPVWHEDSVIMSVPDAIAFGLTYLGYLDKEEKEIMESMAETDMCPVCGAAMTRMEGCITCTVCGFSRC